MKAARSIVICHHDEPLNRFLLPRWLASFTTLSAVIVIHEPPSRVNRRIRRELDRVGLLRFLDVLAFRLYYRVAISAIDIAWENRTLEKLQNLYPKLPPSCRILETTSLNTPEVTELLREVQPDIMIARCKTLKYDLVNTPRCGTYVMQPGICPEYRSFHGCFWALAQNDLENVGMTLARVTPGADLAPLFGYYHCELDEADSHIVTQSRVVFDNLDSIRVKIEDILAGTAHTIDTSGRTPRLWGQPWLTSYVRWRIAARQRRLHKRSSNLQARQ